METQSRGLLVNTSARGISNIFCSTCTNTYWSGTASAAGLAYVYDASIAIDPSRITAGNYEILMGPYSGVMSIKNYLTGGINALSSAIDNLGNPFFSECVRWMSHGLQEGKLTTTFNGIRISKTTSIPKWSALLRSWSLSAIYCALNSMVWDASSALLYCY